MGGVGSGGSKPRKPNHLRALEGVREDRLNRDEPVPSSDAVVCPVELAEGAQVIWNALAPDLIAKKVLTNWDAQAFSAYCRAAAMFNDAAAEVERDGASTERKYQGQVASPAFRLMVAAEKMMTSLGSRFGMSPADRAGLKIDQGAAKSGAEAYVV